jgi:putative ABC transport system permease protein
VQSLNLKLRRDLWHLRGQVLAIAIVVASGVAVIVMSLVTVEALEETAAAYYDRHRFAHVFSSLKRAPESLLRRIRGLPGVQSAESRIVQLATLDVAGFEEPVIGQLVSIPERREPILNRLALRAGRLVQRGSPDEVVLHEPFAEAHGLRPGDRLDVVMNARRRTLQVVGIALSPEYIYALGPGSLMPDDERYGILWMGRDALAAAFDLDSAFNDLALTLRRDARPELVIQQIDVLLDRYGGTGAYDRSDQSSHWFLTNEMKQLRNLAGILSPIFLAVAAFLTNIVLGRLVAVERSEIGLLKAFGYSNLAVSWHYIKLVLCIVGVGVVLGWAVGAWLGRFMTELYSSFFRFPRFFFEPSPTIFLIAAGVSAFAAMDSAVKLPPAEAMRPPAPPLYRKARGAGRVHDGFDQPTRMIFRHIARWPFRSASTVLGLALALALLIASLQWIDAVDYLARVSFFEAQRQDVTLGLIEPESREVLREMRELPGVAHVEPIRAVQARLHAGPRSRRETIQGLPRDATLSPAYDVAGYTVPVPPEGLLMSTELADRLRVGAGDAVHVEVLEGRRPRRTLVVAGLFETLLGTPVYMDIEALNRMLREAPSVSGAHLRVDRLQERALFERLKQLPEVSAVTLRRALIEEFYDTMGEIIYIFISFYATFACALAFGVTYNAARISLSERGRELATLRVLGLSTAEISYILLGEIAALTALSIPLGVLLGYALAWLIDESFATELYRVPMVLEPSSIGVAVVLVLAATAGSAELVRRRVRRLDLIAVLKTRE